MVGPCHHLLMGFFIEGGELTEADDDDGFTPEDLLVVIENRLKEGWPTEPDRFVGRLLIRVIPLYDKGLGEKISRVAQYLARQSPQIGAGKARSAEDYTTELSAFWHDEVEPQATAGAGLVARIVANLLNT